MISLIIVLALGWLLYKALFPEVAPYYGKKLPSEVLLKHKRSERRKYCGGGGWTHNSFRDNSKDIWEDSFTELLPILPKDEKFRLFEDSFAGENALSLGFDDW